MWSPTNPDRVGLKVGAVLLDYPGSTWALDLDEAQDVLGPLSSEKWVCLARENLEAFRRSTVSDLQAEYVALFDFSEKRTLHLTRHEVGDDRVRGQELVRLQARLHHDGWRLVEGMLPDYLPVWLEYLACADVPDESLGKRVYRVLAHIREAIAPLSVYHGLIGWLLMVLPKAEPALPPVHQPVDDERRMPFPIYHRGDVEGWAAEGARVR
ncbi:nitrate reductase molybdenum cofactor assembly chaperone [Sulfobacillus harzensis]|uniref:Nitrate reductase molybdenum cofactor assembly chaperone n=1 Tax=Sulfobacillus harzensis TaxID=2729629 RepID=A0A7Y0Q369_9FIRM|nr:nitrate reductase molybdenum cofactor assembly chaperone [Sulfobacillus harzensis]NMP23252.1 nitrate reductase molybdenum cofactor assembly chaperone [Sulfobacillus harzensis]